MTKITTFFIKASNEKMAIFKKDFSKEFRKTLFFALKDNFDSFALLQVLENEESKILFEYSAKLEKIFKECLNNAMVHFGINEPRMVTVKNKIALKLPALTFEKASGAIRIHEEISASSKTNAQKKRFCKFLPKKKNKFNKKKALEIIKSCLHQEGYLDTYEKWFSTSVEIASAVLSEEL